MAAQGQQVKRMSLDPAQQQQQQADGAEEQHLAAEDVAGWSKVRGHTVDAELCIDWTCLALPNLALGPCSCKLGLQCLGKLPAAGLVPWPCFHARSRLPSAQADAVFVVPLLAPCRCSSC